MKFLVRALVVNRSVKQYDIGTKGCSGVTEITIIFTFSGLEWILLRGVLRNGKAKRCCYLTFKWLHLRYSFTYTNTQVSFYRTVTSGCNSLAKACQGLIFSSFRRQFLAPGHNENR